jgi:hypothetical protein
MHKQLFSGGLLFLCFPKFCVKSQVLPSIHKSKLWKSLHGKVFQRYLDRQKVLKIAANSFSLPIHKTIYKDKKYVFNDKEEEISEKSRSLSTD